MFENDPEMQQLLAERRAMTEPEDKPGWWDASMIVLMALGTGGMAAVAYALEIAVYPAAIFGLLAGGACFAAIFGWWPRRYRYIMGPQEGKRFHLWVRIKPGLRALLALAVPALVAFGVYAAADRAERSAPKRTPAGASRPVARPRTR
jgi:hypothetical protein